MWALHLATAHTARQLFKKPFQLTSLLSLPQILLPLHFTIGGMPFNAISRRFLSPPK